MDNLIHQIDQYFFKKLFVYLSILVFGLLIFNIILDTYTPFSKIEFGIKAIITMSIYIILAIPIKKYIQKIYLITIFKLQMFLDDDD